jgi:hypothetical protein
MIFTLPLKDQSLKDNEWVETVDLIQSTVKASSINSLVLSNSFILWGNKFFWGKVKVIIVLPMSVVDHPIW